MAPLYCRQCLEKQRRLDELKEEIVPLKQRLRYQERTIAEGPFGSATPSSKVPIKRGADAERRARRGGAKVGHRGHGRRACTLKEADRVETAPVAEATCPDCGTRLQSKGVRERTVLECRPVKVEKVVYRLGRKGCPRCGRTLQGRAPGVLPKSQYGNSLLARVAIEHYVHGVTLGRLRQQTGVGIGGLVDAMHQLAGRVKGVSERLAKQYRQAPVKHADETGWRNDGDNGYAWLFCTENLSLFRFRKTRSAAVVREVLGKKKLSGVLVTDRYAAYNQAPCKMQYCYVHLLREVKDLGKNFPEDLEVARFVEVFQPLLSGAIAPRGLKLSKRAFRLQARHIRTRIVEAVNHSARHPAIQKIQNLFRQKTQRLYHWARDPCVPADNNRAERELRPLVIARKISFGSQSDEGAKTREILMTALHTLRKRVRDPYPALKSCLDALAENPHADPFALLFGSTRKPPRH